MAIVQNPITGRTKKKFGTAVFSKQFGSNTMRSKPVDVKNPNTPGQKAQRSKFALMIDTARSVLELIKVSFQGEAVGMSAFNAFISYNIKNAVTGTPGNATIDFSKLLIAKGSLLKCPEIIGSSASAHTVTRIWDPPIDPESISSDELLSTVTFNVDRKLWLIENSCALRSLGTYTQTLPVSWSNDEVHVYSFFVSPDGRKNSDSIYGGLITVL
ncbi:MAG: hypothetical protein A2046_17155 [Bacteroidetes bacterium GWA2_30_7]|nr:MAG: hypothetical protein A2046_17155 [Bacteroidetes bacterium GWA2_30_7]